MPIIFSLKIDFDLKANYSKNMLLTHLRMKYLFYNIIKLFLLMEITYYIIEMCSYVFGRGFQLHIL